MKNMTSTGANSYEESNNQEMINTKSHTGQVPMSDSFESR